MIRNAVSADVPRMVELGKAMHAEGKFRVYDFDPAVLERTITDLIASPRGIAFVTEVEEKVVGGFIGYLTEHFFGKELASYDLALFLDPSHRKGRTGLRLVQHYVQQAREKGASEVVIANSTGYEKDRVARLFEGLGFTHDGYVFSMRGLNEQA